MSLKAGHKITHAIPENKLTEHHAPHLVPTCESPYMFISGILRGYAVKNHDKVKTQ